MLHINDLIKYISHISIVRYYNNTFFVFLMIYYHITPTKKKNETKFLFFTKSLSHFSFQ